MSIFCRLLSKFSSSISNPTTINSDIPTYTNGLQNLNKLPMSRPDFEAYCNSVQQTHIYHVTDEESAASIALGRVIYGKDVVSSAHFHNHPNNAAAQAASHGAILGFSWSGPEKNIILSQNLTTHGDRSPNVLFKVPASDYSDGIWEIRLYPGTNIGLTLHYIELSGTGYQLTAPVSVKVISA